MKLNFRDLKQQNFSIEAEASETIADVKGKIAAEKGFDAAHLKLIYSGKILKDTDTVESYKFEPKSYIVCMQQKPKAAAAPKEPSTPAPAAAQTPSAPAPSSATTAQAPSTPSPAPAAAAAGAAAQPQSPRQINDPSTMSLGAEREATLSNLESMGFSRADCEAALRAAFFNADRAVEYLLNGIPESARQPAPTARAAAPQQQQQTQPAQPAGGAQAEQGGEGDEPVNLFEAAARATQGGGQRGGGAARASAPSATGGESNPQGAAAGNNLDFLRENQTFQHLRQLVQQQPQMLETVLQQLAASNPQLAQLISSNPDQFLQLLAEQGDDGEEGAPMPPGAQSISVTEEERDAIERLCRLGFERDLVIQAYFACDKNEELAANFLFENPDDDGGDSGAPGGGQ